MVLAGSSCFLATDDCFLALARYETDRPDFSHQSDRDITVAPGGTGSTTLTVNSIDGFALPLQFGLYRTQTGGTFRPA